MSISAISVEISPLQAHRLDNVQLMAQLRRAQTHCKRNHPLSGDNLRLDTDAKGNTRRCCKECKRVNYKQRRALLLDEMKYDKQHYLHGRFYGYTVGCRCFRCRIKNSRYRAELKTRRENARA